MRIKNNIVSKILIGLIALTTVFGRSVATYADNTGSITIRPNVISGDDKSTAGYDGTFNVYRIASFGGDKVTENGFTANSALDGYGTTDNGKSYPLAWSTIIDDSSCSLLAIHLRDYISQHSIDTIDGGSKVGAGTTISGLQAGVYLVTQASYDSSKWSEARPGIVVIGEYLGEDNWNVTVSAKVEKYTTPPDEEKKTTDIHISTGKTAVSKYDSVDGHVLSGVTFNLYKSDGTVVGQYTTDEDGLIYVSGLPMGSYYFREVHAQDGYILDGSHIVFTVSNTWDTATNRFSNTPEEVNEGGNDGTLDEGGNLDEGGMIDEVGGLTGDNSPMMVYGAVAGAAAVLLVVWFCLRRRNRNEK